LNTPDPPLWFPNPYNHLPLAWDWKCTAAGLIPVSLHTYILTHSSSINTATQLANSTNTLLVQGL
jgi:hypothetical protein